MAGVNWVSGGAPSLHHHPEAVAFGERHHKQRSSEAEHGRCWDSARRHSGSVGSERSSWSGSRVRGMRPWGATMGETRGGALGTHTGHWADWDPGVATGLAERLSRAAAGMHTLRTYMYNFHRWTAILLSQRRQQDEATSAVGVYVSAGHIGLRRSVCPATCTCVLHTCVSYTCALYTCACVGTYGEHALNLVTG